MKKDTSVILICLYVDDLLVAGNDLKGIEFFKAQIMQEFDMVDLGTLAYFLGLEFVTTSKGILLHQQKYATDVLKIFHMVDCNPANTPTEVNTKLEITEEEEAVDPTMYKQLLGSTQFRNHPHEEDFLWTKTHRYFSIMQLRTSVWSSVRK